MRKDLSLIQKKKKKISNTLEANRARDSLVRLDASQCQPFPSSTLLSSSLTYSFPLFLSLLLLPPPPPHHSIETSR